MDIEKLIEQLNDWNENLISELCADDKLTCDDLCDREDCIVVRAAKALSTLQAENEKLRAELDEKEKYYDQMIDALSATDSTELERVKRERDAAIEYLREIEWCAGCKHFEGLDGCKKWATGQCTEKHDLYEFVGPEKEDWQWNG